MTMTPDDVLTFWFEEAGPDKWFEKSDDFDAEIADRFGALTHAARDGKLVTWLETPRGCLALIILIDQFSRNIHRDSPLAWSADAHALALTRLALDKQFDEQLELNARKFLYMPLMHSEDLKDQKLCVEVFGKLVEAGAEGGETNLDYAVRHRAIIARFGRFPHRKEILGRESSEEERAFLEEPNSSF